jgi:hypothetical protein
MEMVSYFYLTTLVLLILVRQLYLNHVFYSCYAGDSSLGAKPSFEPNTEVDCSDWVSSSRSIEEGESSSGDLSSNLDTEVASSLNTIVLGASNPSDR